MSPIKNGGNFFLKPFMADGGAIYWETVLHGGLISDHAKGGGVSQIHFSVIIFHYSNREGIYT